MSDQEPTTDGPSSVPPRNVPPTEAVPAAGTVAQPGGPAGAVTDVTADSPQSPEPPPPPVGREGRFHGLPTSYWRLLTANVTSNLGDGITALALPWLATTLTTDPFQIALVGVAVRLPWLLFALLAGVIADRRDRRRLMIACNLTRAAILALIAVGVATGIMTIPILVVGALALGFTEVLFDNTGQTILPSIVPKDRLERANGTMWGAETITNNFIGPPLGGFLIALSLTVPFLVDATTAVVSALLILTIRGRFRTAEETARADEPRRSVRADIGEGLTWLWRHRFLRTLALVLAGLNGTMAMTMGIMVLYAQELLGLGEIGFGIFMTAGAIGGLIGSQTAEVVARRLGPGGAMALSVGVLSGTMTVMGLTSSPWIAGAAGAITTFFAIVWNVVTVSLRQTIIPDRILGRVNSVYRFLSWGIMPIGLLIGGLIASGLEPVAGREIGLRAPFLVGAALHVPLLVVALRRLTTRDVEAAKAAAVGTATPGDPTGGGQGD